MKIKLEYIVNFQYIIENNFSFDSIFYCYKDSENQIFK